MNDFHRKESQVKYEGIKVDIVDSLEDTLKICEQMTQSKIFSFDVKTTSNNPFEAKIEKITFCNQENEVFEIKLNPEEKDDEGKLEAIKKVLKNAQTTKIVQNAKFIIEVMKLNNIEVEFPLWDTMIAHYIINPDLLHNNQYMSQEYYSQRAAVMKIWRRK